MMAAPRLVQGARLLKIARAAWRSRGVTKFYDAIAGDYDALFGRYQARHATTVVAAVRTLREGRFARALDLCCGTGILSRRLARVAGQVTGIDRSPGMLAVAAQASRGRYALQLGDAFNLDKLGERYDLITCLGGISHLRPDDYDRFAASVAGHLDEKGYVVCALPPPPWRIADSRSCGESRRMDVLLEPIYNCLQRGLGYDERRGHERRHLAASLARAGLEVGVRNVRGLTLIVGQRGVDPRVSTSIGNSGREGDKQQSSLTREQTWRLAETPDAL